MKPLKLSFIIGLLLGAFFSLSCAADELEDQLNEVQVQMQEIVDEAQSKFDSKESQGKQDLKKMMQISLAPFREMSDADLHDHVKRSLEQTGAGPLLKKYPEAITIVSDLLKDDEALPSLSEIVQNRERLWIFLAANIGIIFLGFVLRKLTANDKDGLIVRLKKGVFRFLFLNVLRVATFVFFFYAEIMPTWHILKDNLY